MRDDALTSSDYGAIDIESSTPVHLAPFDRWIHTQTPKNAVECRSPQDSAIESRQLQHTSINFNPNKRNGLQFLVDEMLHAEC